MTLFFTGFFVVWQRTGVSLPTRSCQTPTRTQKAIRLIRSMDGTSRWASSMCHCTAPVVHLCLPWSSPRSETNPATGSGARHRMCHHDRQTKLSVWRLGTAYWIKCMAIDGRNSFRDKLDGPHGCHPGCLTVWLLDVLVLRWSSEPTRRVLIVTACRCRLAIRGGWSREDKRVPASAEVGRGSLCCRRSDPTGAATG